jgi:hypothetical protein
MIHDAAAVAFAVDHYSMLFPSMPLLLMMLQTMLILLQMIMLL